MNLFNYMHDGASSQAQAVLAYLRRDGIECSWCDKQKAYLAEPKVARWENCREQGYIVSLRHKGRQLNIAFFEHRNSDRIEAVEWEQYSINSITIETADFGGKYKDKYDTDASFKYGEAHKMADWIYERLEAFWKRAQDKKD